MPNKRLLAACALALAGAAAATPAPAAAPTPEAMRSPVNQVFQFTSTGQYARWADASKTTATAYLWVPEECRRLRGLLILCSNVPEHMLAGDRTIRDACARHDLGIVFFPKSFFNFSAKTRNEGEKDVEFLQQMLDGLAAQSGYEEVATAPWLPIGESGHLLMVDALVEHAPDRCLAGIWLKNNHLPPKDRKTPALVIFGSAQEWGQTKSDYRTRWNDVAKAYADVLGERKAHPDWPLSYLIDGTSGHFDCSDRLTRVVARYVDWIAQSRLPDDPGAALRPLDPIQGYVADLAVPGRADHPPAPAAVAGGGGAAALPWFPDRAFAEEAQSIAAINWNAASQLPAFADANGHTFPFSLNGISWLSLNQEPVPLPDGTVPPVLVSEPDGITFQINATLLDKLPPDFVGAGQSLATTPGTPTAEWMCGCVEPLGGNRFRLALDRTWPSPIYIALRQPGNGSVRTVVQPGQIGRDMNNQGAPQKITFEKLPDVPAGTESVPLRATSDAGLPVRYFVVVGPAVIDGDRLVLTRIPPRSKLPLTVTVAAWQFGRYASPKIKRAEIVRQSFQILPH